MKIIKMLVLSCLITVIPVRSSQAAVAAGAAILGSPIASGLAVAGLGSIGVGFIATITSGSCDGGGCAVYLLLGGMLGLIILDGDVGNIVFQKISPLKANELKVSTLDIEIYNSEIEEVNLVFSEVKSQLNESSTIEDSREIWSENSDLLSVETFKVLKAIADKK